MRWFFVITWLWIVRMVWVSTLSHATWNKNVYMLFERLEVHCRLFFSSCYVGFFPLLFLMLKFTFAPLLFMFLMNFCVPEENSYKYYGYKVISVRKLNHEIFFLLLLASRRFAVIESLINAWQLIIFGPRTIKLQCLIISLGEFVCICRMSSVW